MYIIKTSAEISEMFSRGKRIHTPFLTIVYASEKTEGAVQHDLRGRVAFIAGKKSGNAVWRNSAKRRMRAICHELGGPFPNLDVIFLAKSGICRAKYSKVLETCDEALKRAGIR